MNNPLIGFIKTIGLMLGNRVSFNRKNINRSIQLGDGREFKIFRQVTIRKKRVAEPQAYFVVRFKLKKMNIQKNIRFSRLPMMVFMGFKGFRSKFWAVDEKTGLFQGLYQWQTLEDAENYSKSIAMKFMTNRSEPSSVWYEMGEGNPQYKIT